MDINALQLAVLKLAAENPEGKILTIETSDGPREVLGNDGEFIPVGGPGLQQLVGAGLLKNGGRDLLFLTPKGWKYLVINPSAVPNPLA